jgi:hypothetical protein
LTWFEIFIGCGLVVGGIFGKEFYPGRAGKQRGLKPLDPWIGRLIFIGFGIAFILDAVEKLTKR